MEEAHLTQQDSDIEPQYEDNRFAIIIRFPHVLIVSIATLKVVSSEIHQLEMISDQQSLFNLKFHIEDFDESGSSGECR